MKKITIATGLLLTSVAFADVDYSRCNQNSLGIAPAFIDNDGKIQKYDYVEFESVTTNGKTETYVLRPKKGYAAGFGGGFVTSSTIKIERDDNGNIIKIQTGGEKPEQQTIEAWKKIYSNQGSGFGGGYVGGSGSGLGAGFNQGGFGGYGSPVYNIDGQSVPLENVTTEQAKKAGFGNSVEQYRKLNSQRRRDKKTLTAMKETYKKIHDKADYVIPFGSESELEIKDGVCMLKSMSNRQYSTKTKEVSTELSSSREGCEEIKKLYKKYEPRINECQNVTSSLNKEYYENFESKKKVSVFGGINGGYAGGYAGGIAGGYVGGMAGGYAGGYHSNNIQGPIIGALTSCEMYYGVQPIRGMGGFGGGAFSQNPYGSQQ